MLGGISKRAQKRAVVGLLTVAALASVVSGAYVWQNRVSADDNVSGDFAKEHLEFEWVATVEDSSEVGGDETVVTGVEMTASAVSGRLSITAYDSQLTDVVVTPACISGCHSTYVLFGLSQFPGIKGGTTQWSGHPGEGWSVNVAKGTEMEVSYTLSTPSDMKDHSDSALHGYSPEGTYVMYTLGFDRTLTDAGWYGGQTMKVDETFFASTVIKVEAD